MSDQEITEEQAVTLIAEHHIVAMAISPSTYEFELGNGQTLTLWMTRDDGDWWELTDDE